MSKASLSRWLLAMVCRANRYSTGLSIRLTKWTGKSCEYIHPKHLVNNPDYAWYLPYVEADCRLLDIGCGNGMHMFQVATKAKFVVGFDYDKHSLGIARREAKRRASTKTHFVLASAEEPFPFQDASFDAVLFLDVIEHLYDRVCALREIARVLKPDGLLFIAAPNCDTSWKRRLRSAGLFYYSDPDHKVEYTPTTLLKELEVGGFIPVSALMPIVYDTPLAGFIDLVGGVSLSLYARLGRWKRKVAQRRPEESIGWRVVCRKR